MSALADLQRRFLAAIVAPDARVAPELRAEGGIDTNLGLHIYSHAYQARLREVLGKDHAILAMYLGEDAWHALCRAYLAAHPSRHPSLRQFGDALPDFLAGDPTFAANRELAELARFERQLLDCFDAPAAPVATWTQLQALPADAWPGLRLGFTPGTRRLPTASNAVAIWIALKAGHAPPPANRVAAEWLCWRNADLVTQFRSLDDEESILLDHFFIEGDFAGACELLVAWHPESDVPARAVEHLVRWAGEGLVSEWQARLA